ncbi:MAG TPA: hypothetical protein VGH50_03615 [Candidatus Binatia bacterium]|jgi:hypothetical protein
MADIKAELSKAEDYMTAGDLEAASALIQNLLHRFPKSESLYGEVVNIYLAGKMFDEAKEVFSRYKSEFGEDLHADFSLEEIAREQKEDECTATTYEKTGVKVFRRMSAWQRGRASGLAFTGWSSIFPVKEIRLSAREIVLKKGNREYHFAWPEIEDTYITKRKGYKGAPFSEPIIKTLHFKTKDRTFEIDVSEIYPDFKNSDLLLEELRKHIPLREE